MNNPTKFPWLTLVLLVVFLVLTWINFGTSTRKLVRDIVDRRPVSSRHHTDAHESPRTYSAPSLATNELSMDDAQILRPEEINNIAIYRAVSPSVVSVVNRALVRGGLFGLQVVEVPQGAGSGFVWDRAGHIISNYHVVHQATALTVTFPDGTSFAAKVVGIAPDYDIAVLKIDAPPELLTPVHVGASHGLQVGQSVLAIGNPFGMDTTLTVGVVSALGRNITSMTERRIQDVIQTDAAINPGNSGGPLLNSRGQLIGINTAILSPSGAYSGIGFAVPSDTVSRVVPQLIHKGKVSRAGLGVQLMPNHMARRLGAKGVVLLAVIEGSSAQRAGLVGVTQSSDGDIILGDVITAVDGVSVENVDDLVSYLDRKRSGDKVAITCYRHHQPEREVKLTLQELN